MNRKILETKRKWWLLSLSLIICHLSFSNAAAQTFTQRIQQDARTGGKVSVTHSKAIDELVNGKSSETQPQLQQQTQPAVVTPVAPLKQQTAKPAVVTQATPAKQEPQKPVQAVTTTPTKQETAKVSPPRRTEQPADTATTLPPTDGRKKVMVGSYKVTGYRVQAFAGGNQRKDRQKAEQIAANIKAHYPSEPVYTHFYSPRWICRVGNYRTYEEAHEMLLAIRKLGYSSAIIVKGKITVQN